MRPHIEDLVDRAVEQTLTPEALTRVFGTVLQSIFSAFRERNGFHESISRTDAPPEISEEAGIEPGAPGRINELSDDAAPTLYINRRDDFSVSDIQSLGNLVEQAPGQEVEFDFVKFLKSFEEEDRL
ncbi:hypothetical protein BGZ61DRAFT_455231, partial [Ilyonectria robusta]|uniref:uncharacterized protein n=1 Tax=Ilyonectria robusta TaxID=1079257 RepID=UPI001E8D1088